MESHDLEQMAEKMKNIFQTSDFDDNPYFKVIKKLKSELKDRGYSDKDTAIMIKNIEIDVDEPGYEAIKKYDLISDFAEALAETYESHKKLFPTYYREVFSHNHSLSFKLKSD